MPKGLGWGGGDRTDPANAAVHAHLERMAREANGSPAPGESTEEFSPSTPQGLNPPQRAKSEFDKHSFTNQM